MPKDEQLKPRPSLCALSRAHRLFPDESATAALGRYSRSLVEVASTRRARAWRTECHAPMKRREMRVWVTSAALHPPLAFQSQPSASQVIGPVAITSSQ